MKKILYYFGLACIAVFLFTIHAKYLYRLIPSNETDLFVFFDINLKVYLPYVWGAAFGVVTAIILSLLDRSDSKFWLFVFCVAFLEFLGVWLYNQTELKENWFWTMSSLYYGIYSGFIIIIYAYIKVDNNLDKVESIIESNNINDLSILNPKYQKVVEMLKEGKSGSEINTELGIHTSTISRLKKEYCN